MSMILSALMVKSHKLADLLVQQQAVVVEESDVAAGGVGADAGGGEGLRQLWLEEVGLLHEEQW